MADTLIERVTGRPAQTATPVAVNLVLSDETLLGGESTAATLTDYGPIPAAVARRLIEAAMADPNSRASLRRLYAHPKTGALVAMESRSRLFPKALARLLDLRDQRCRTPYCDARIRHHDHATAHARGGGTTTDNGLGTCAACNYTKEAAGWRVQTGTDQAGRHTADYTTPTGAHHRSTAPPVIPGRLRIDLSEIEAVIGIALTDIHAA